MKLSAASTNIVLAELQELLMSFARYILPWKKYRQLLKKPPLLILHTSKLSFAQQGEDLVLERVLKRVLSVNLSDGGIYVDVGAFDATRNSVTYLLYLNGWSGIAFDFSNRACQSFNVFRPDDIFVQAIAGSDDMSKVDFFVPDDFKPDKPSTICSKYPKLDKHSYRRVNVLQVNLSDELKRRNIGRIDVLNLDIEGAEVEVLESFDFDLHKPKVIVVEIFGVTIEDCLSSRVSLLLKAKGYKPVASSAITFFFVASDS